MFFKGSLTGLEASSIVTYRGVRIGQVTAIEITENKAKSEVEIPVYVQFLLKNIRSATQPYADAYQTRLCC